MFAILQSTVHPIDSAFVAGRLDLPTVASQCAPVTQAVHWDDNGVLLAVAMICLVAAMALVQQVLNIFSSLVGCLIRWKECLNLESSAALSRDRDIVAIYTTFPLCLIISSYGLWELNFMKNLNPAVNYLITLGVIIAYLMLRVGLTTLLTPNSYNRKTYLAAAKAFGTFTIIAALLLFATAAIMGIVGIDRQITTQVLLWEIAGVYAIHVLRKLQILGSCCSFFSTFLYLCALEILPTGILVALAVLF